MAWTEGTAFRVDLASRRSLWSSVTSGELLMCYFRGPGTVWMQTRNEKAFRQWLNGDGTQFRKSWSGVPALIILVLAVLIIGTVIGAALYSTQFNGY